MTKPFLTAPSKPMWSLEVLVVPVVTPILPDLINGRSVCIVTATAQRSMWASRRVAEKLSARGVKFTQSQVGGRYRVTVPESGGTVNFFTMREVEVTRGFVFDTALILAPSAKYHEFDLEPVARVLRSRLRPR